MRYHNSIVFHNNRKFQIIEIELLQCSIVFAELQRRDLSIVMCSLCTNQELALMRTWPSSNRLILLLFGVSKIHYRDRPSSRHFQCRSRSIVGSKTLSYPPVLHVKRSLYFDEHNPIDALQRPYNLNWLLCAHPLRKILV
jgi:hypothetical protein